MTLLIVSVVGFGGLGLWYVIAEALDRRRYGRYFDKITHYAQNPPKRWNEEHTDGR